MSAVAEAAGKLWAARAPVFVKGLHAVLPA